ncbi:MAG: ABC transporter family substrate-binding protein, partial [Propionibacteriaceae bacterium]
MKTRRLIAVPLLAGALALGACGGPGGDGEGGGPGDEPTSAPITAQDINAKDRSELAEGGELRQAVSAFAENWNPMHVNGNNADFTDVREAMSPSLFQYDETGAATPDPNYLLEATTEGGESADEPLVVTYKLNPEAVWNDGSPIDVDDFIAEWKACGDPESDFQCVSTQGYDSITGIEAGADNFEVKVTYSGPYPDWTGTFVLKKAESIKDAKTFNEGWTDLNKIGDWFSGPFKLDNLDKTQQIITLVPNDKWWGEKPLLDKLTFRVISADATASSYENNEIDTFDIGPNPDAYARAKGVAAGAIRAAAGPNFRHFTLNQEAGMLQDKAVRQAIVMGLDRAQIGVSDLAGIDWPAKPLNNHVFMETQEGYADSAEATGLNYNPDGAKKLLEDEGWAMGDDGYYAKDGETLTVKFSQIVAVPVSENEALQAQAM